MRWLVVVAALAAGGCANKQSAGSGAEGSGTGIAPPGGCDGARARVEQLYRAEAQASEPSRVEEAVADNTAMVMNDCAKDPARVSACIASAQTVQDLERRCIVPLDDDGREGDALAR